MTQAVVHGVLRCDRFVLDLTRGCLRVGDEDIELRPKAFEVLRYLAQNAGRLVAKQELYDAVWPNVIVSDGSIAQCIRELRSKLGDGNHSLIKTVSRRGYLLDATVLVGAPQRPPDGLAVMPSEAPQPQPGSRQRVGTIAAHKLGAWAVVAACLYSDCVKTSPRCAQANKQKRRKPGRQKGDASPQADVERQEHIKEAPQRRPPDRSGRQRLHLDPGVFLR